LGALAALLAAVPEADAGVETRAVRFVPSPSQGVVGYRLHLSRPDSGYTYDVDLGDTPTPPNSSGVRSFELTFEDAYSYQLTLFAYTKAQLESPPSNMITLGAASCASSSQCPAAGQCTTGVCSPSGCGVVNLNNGTTCNDGNSSTTNDACLAGTCIGQSPQPTPQCSSDSQCGDGNLCNGTERCASGSCVAGSPLVCGGSGQCSSGICDARVGCMVESHTSGSSCNDGDSGTLHDICVGGSCVGVECLADSECGSGGSCSNGTCQSTEPPPEPEPEPEPGPVAGGPEDYSISFDGSGEHLIRTSQQKLGVTRDFSASVWIKPTRSSGTQQILSLGPRTGTRNEISIVAYNDAPGDPIRVSSYASDGNERIVLEFDGQQQMGQWLHIGLSHSSFTLIVTFNGQKATPSRTLSNEYGTALDTERQVVIGANKSGSGDFFQGFIGHVAVWGDNLPSSHLAAIYEGGHEIDLRQESSGYRSADELEHYWRLGYDAINFGRDEGSTRRDLSRVGMSSSNRVVDSPSAR
jgi:Cys-rich repeat protein